MKISIESNLLKSDMEHLSFLKILRFPEFVFQLIRKEISSVMEKIKKKFPSN